MGQNTPTLSAEDRRLAASVGASPSEISTAYAREARAFEDGETQPQMVERMVGRPPAGRASTRTRQL